MLLNGSDWLSAADSIAAGGWFPFVATGQRLASRQDRRAVFEMMIS